MEHRVWVVGAVALGLAAGCNTTVPMNDAERAAIADSVSQVAAQWMADLSKQPTVERYAAAFAPGADILHAEKGTLITTRDSILGAARAAFSTAASFSAVMKERRVLVPDRDVAVLGAQVDLAVKDSAGKEWSGREAWTAVFHRTPDGWKIVADHESFPPEPAPATPVKRSRRRE